MSRTRHHLLKRRPSWQWMTTPEPVNQMLLAALKELLPMFSEWHAQFPEHIGDKEEPALQQAEAAIAAAEQAPQPTELTDEQIRAIVYDTRYNGIYATVRACIAAAQKGTK